VLRSTSSYTGASYLWSDGGADSTITVSATGRYSLTVTIGVCSQTDAINVSFTPDYSVHLGRDTMFCTATSVILESSDAHTGATYRWSTGGTGPTGIVDPTGSYWRTVEQSWLCTQRGAINIRIISDSLDIAGARYRHLRWCSGASLCRFSRSWCCSYRSMVTNGRYEPTTALCNHSS